LAHQRRFGPRSWRRRASLCENTRRWAAANPHSGPVVKDAAELRDWLARQEEAEVLFVREDPPPYDNA